MCTLTALLIALLAYILLVYFLFCRNTVTEHDSSSIEFLEKLKMLPKDDKPCGLYYDGVDCGLRRLHAYQALNGCS